MTAVDQRPPIKNPIKAKRGTGLEASARALISAKVCPLPLKKGYWNRA